MRRISSEENSGAVEVNSRSPMSGMVSPRRIPKYTWQLELLTRTVLNCSRKSAENCSRPTRSSTVLVTPALETTAPAPMRRPPTCTPLTRPFSTRMRSTRAPVRMCTPLPSSSSAIRPISRSVPPSKVYTPRFMKLEKTMP